jgi:hypothetical protein
MAPRLPTFITFWAWAGPVVKIRATERINRTKPAFFIAFPPYSLLKPPTKNDVGKKASREVA